MIINYYFTLRLKQVVRISKEIGLVRSMFLLGLLSLAFYLLTKINQSWIVPTTTSLGLILYHNERRDKEFLRLQIKHAIALLQAEYLLIGLPFMIMECFKGHFLGAVTIAATAVALPYLKTIKMTPIVLPMPFLYKGGLEYIRLFRQCGWLYLLLLAATLMGAMHDNITLGKVALIIWTYIQTITLLSVTQKQELTFFLNYATFQRHLVRSCVWNISVTATPLVVMILSFSATSDNILFCASAMVGSILYLWNMSMARYLFSSSAMLISYMIMPLLPLSFYTFFIPILLVPFALINGACYMLLKTNTKQIWN